ncbi:IclR family transcriptional regulator [Microbaculum marinisediminis]|uniref:IclR family transcriptional regulator n=1 Tax=Microbaculum marinisediminis TaxID=2931392 RepID=A0AAW5R5W7_9HYPH|nr:IclR family transcriptional regulator [Microbaculum sp. A6E488]MCT8974303.1 IclR family transcriptional regulator [Microbaculum sp. A6E488]
MTGLCFFAVNAERMVHPLASKRRRELHGREEGERGEMGVSSKGAAAGATHGMNVRAVVRATDILKTFGQRPLQTLSEVASAAGLDKGTTRRLLVTLMNCGFVVQDPVSQRYGLGRAVRALAVNVIDDFDLRSIAVPVLADIAAELHLTTFLSVYRDHSALCLERLHDMQGMEVRWWPIGGTLPINSGGAPKLLLAYQSDDEIDAMLSQPLETMTPAATTDPEELRAHLQVIRARGWEFAVDDVSLGLAALAVPVLDAAGQIVCALSMAGLTPQMIGKKEPAHLRRMLAAAETVRRSLGW